MRIGVDLDGSAYQFVGALRFCVDGSLETHPDPCMYEVWHCWNMPRKDWQAEVAAHTEFGDLFSVGEPYPHAVEVLQEWKQRGHSIHIITDRGHSANAVAQTYHWLEKWSVPHDAVTFTSGVKAKIAQVDVLIDDKPDQVRRAWSEGIRAVLIPRLYNQQPSGCRSALHTCDKEETIGWSWNDLRDCEFIR